MLFKQLLSLALITSILHEGTLILSFIISPPLLLSLSLSHIPF
jgi:hypothetical protein